MQQTYGQFPSSRWPTPSSPWRREMVRTWRVGVYVHGRGRVLRAVGLRRSAQNSLQQTRETCDLLLHGLHSLPEDKTEISFLTGYSWLAQPGAQVCLPGLRLVPQQRRAEPPRAPSLSSRTGHQAELLSGETQPWTLTPGFWAVPEH